MTSAYSIYDKLRLLAQLDKASMARIREIDEKGWELIRYPMFGGRSEYLNFSKDSTFDKLDVLFGTLIEDAIEGRSGRKGVAGFLCPALKGLSYHLHLFYGDRASPGSGGLALTDPNVLVSARAMRIIPERFAEIEQKIQLLAASISWFRFPETFTQDRFIPDPDILGDGVCFGISTNWCLRFLSRGKKSYSTSKKPAPALSGNDTGADQGTASRDQERMAKKAPFIYHLQNAVEEKARNLKVNESTNIAAAFFKQPDTEQLEKMDRLLRATPRYLNKSPQTNVQHFINRKFVELGDARIKKTYLRQGEGCALGLHSISSTDPILIKFVNDLLSNCQGTGKRAYVIGLTFSSTTKKGASIPYFVKTHSGGHAIGLHCSEGGRWGLLDPSYGEVQNQSKHGIAEILCDLLSFYSITRNIWKVFVFEVSAG